MNSPRSAKFADVPAWVRPVAPDVATFFSALALAGLEGQWIRLRAFDQRSLLGCAPFGQCAIKSNGNSVEVFRSVCFGTDSECYEYSAAELAAKIAGNELCKPGVYGKINR